MSVGEASEDFGVDVAGTAALDHELALVGAATSQSEVANAHLESLLVEHEYVVGLQVAVEHLLALHEVDREQQLDHDLSDGGFVDGGAVVDVVAQGAALGEAHDQVHLVGAAVHRVERDDRRAVQQVPQTLDLITEVVWYALTWLQGVSLHSEGFLLG